MYAKGMEKLRALAALSGDHIEGMKDAAKRGDMDRYRNSLLDLKDKIKRMETELLDGY